jgi:hypothetical protein
LLRRSTSGDQRARVRGPREGRVFCRSVRATFLCSRVRCMRFEECMRTSFPSSAPSGHPLSPVRRREGRRPVLAVGPNQDPHSDADPRRSTPSRRPGCLPPLQPRRAFKRRIAPYSNLARWSLAHAAHTFSTGCGGCLHGHCKRQSAVTRDPWHSRNRPPLLPMGSILSDLSCLGQTTQARPSARPSLLVCESRLHST